MEDMSAKKFPRIPRPNENVPGWGAYINKNGREGSEPIIREAFTVHLARDEEVTDNGGPEREAELGERPECG